MVLFKIFKDFKQIIVVENSMIFTPKTTKWQQSSNLQSSSWPGIMKLYRLPWILDFVVGSTAWLSKIKYKIFTHIENFQSPKLQRDVHITLNFPQLLSLLVVQLTHGNFHTIYQWSEQELFIFYVFVYLWVEVDNKKYFILAFRSVKFYDPSG